MLPSDCQVDKPRRGVMIDAAPPEGGVVMRWIAYNMFPAWAILLFGSLGVFCWLVTQNEQWAGAFVIGWAFGAATLGFYPHNDSGD